MKTILVEKKEDFSHKEYVRRIALETDYSTLIKEDCKLVDKSSGQLLGVYLVMPKHDMELLKALLTIKYDKNRRLAGLITKSRIFGYKPREKIRNDFCTATQLSRESPTEHKIICDFSKVISKYYKKFCGEIYHEHEEITKTKLLPEWTLEGTPFSSGIVNRNNALHYHFDTGNYRNVYSNMVAFKSNVKGGYLSIPQYDIAMEIADNSLMLFDGQKILHGVTPFKLLSENAYRISVVYYSLQQMWKCEPMNTELARIKDVRTELEKRRLLRMQGQIPNEI